jgi:hypothetical protein
MFTNTLTATPTCTPTTLGNPDLLDVAAVALDSIADQVLLSQGHCVNMFLDLYSATDDYALRWAIAERLDDIRFVNAVSADDMRADLCAIVEIASADDPFACLPVAA